ncbi:MAG: glycogen synthase GlgA [Candidatus Margulisiibacteriota bacterium]
MKILYAASEVVPFAKTGGLADVAGALPKALADLGHEIKVFLPRYKKVDINKFKLKIVMPNLEIQLGEALVMVNILEGKIPGSNVAVYFIDNDYYFGSRDELYVVEGKDYPDNPERFALYCKATLAFIEKTGWKPNLVHANDWQAALLIAYIKVLNFTNPFYENTATVYSIHNLGYLGLFPKEKMPVTGLGWDQFTPEKLEFWDQLALTKAGFVYADVINTVSETYAKEIQTPEFGHGLDGLLRSRRHEIFGIVNGVDYDLWDPATDPKIVAHYSVKNLVPKGINKETLQKEQGLSVNKNIPLIGMTTRLADQKGLDILSGMLEDLLHMQAQLVVLGCGEPKYHQLLTELQKKYPEHLALNLGFDAALAQMIYAASDMFLMPSLYEPCGLGQLISFKYGTIPIVRKTGGLADTVQNFNPRTGAGNGFVFEEYSSAALQTAVESALDIYRKKTIWKKLQEKVMRYDYSWNVSAKKYVALYLQALQKRIKV